MIVLHGLGDHIGCHEVAMQMLVKRGYTVEGLDWPGNGQSTGRRGDIPGVRPAMDVIRELIASIDSPIVGLYCHSTGVFLAAAFLTHHRELLPDLEWLWCSSPLLCPSHGQSKLKQLASSVLADWVPEMTVPTGVRPSLCIHISDFDTARIKKVFAGCHSQISVRFGRDLLLWEEQVAEAALTLDDPLRILLTQGEGDRVCPARYAIDWFESMPASDKTIKLFPEIRHEPLREPDNAAFLSAVERWLDNC